MRRHLFLILVLLFLGGCGSKEIYSYVDEDNYISISYPVTNIGVLDDEISAFANKVYSEFKTKYRGYKKPELNAPQRGDLFIV